MDSSSMNSASPVRTLSNNYYSDDSDMVRMEAYNGMSGENLEKSLTNLNIHIASIIAKREEQAKVLKEFCANFMKQEEIIAEETKELRMEMMKLRKNTNRGF